MPKEGDHDDAASFIGVEPTKSYTTALGQFPSFDEVIYEVQKLMFLGVLKTVIKASRSEPRVANKRTDRRTGTPTVSHAMRAQPWRTAAAIRVVTLRFLPGRDVIANVRLLPRRPNRTETLSTVVDLAHSSLSR